jgi:hypothetical protein
MLHGNDDFSTARKLASHWPPCIYSRIINLLPAVIHPAGLALVAAITDETRRQNILLE